jgi:thioesterase domain-containing protein
VLNHPSFVADVPWDQAGGDSLALLRLRFLIEEMICTQLSLDALSPEATPSDLITAIERSLDSALMTQASSVADSRPRIFFLPPYGGDEPTLARFRTELQDSYRFTVITYPSWREMLDTRASFDVVVSAAVAQILANNGGEPCLLAGYSFGGFVAWEAARRLIDSGTEVKFVGLIDTRRASVLKQALISRTSKIFHADWWKRKFDYIVSWQPILRSLIRISAYPILRRMGQLVLLLPAEAAYSFHSSLIRELRSHSLKKLTFGPLEISAMLFRSDDALSITPDFGWGPLCRKLTVVSVGGSHTSLFELPHRAILRQRFLEALNEACNRRELISRSL